MSEQRTKKFHIAFTDSEFERLQTFANNSDLSKSEFIREAIRNKIRTIEHPEYYNGVVKEVRNGLSKAEIKQEQHQKTVKADIGKFYSQTMQELKELSKQVNRRITPKKDLDLVTSTLRDKFEANLEEMREYTKLKPEILKDILQDKNLFSINILNGKYKLKGGLSNGK